MSGTSPESILYDSNGNLLAVQNATAIPASTPGLLFMGSDGTNSRYITVDSSGRPVMVGAGVAGTPAGGVFSIQGVAGGTNLPVTVSGTATISGTVTANQGTANTIGNSWPVEMTDGTNILGTAAHPVRTDPTGSTTQPVSGTVTANAGSGNFAVVQATAANLNATVVASGNFNNASVSATAASPPASATYIGGSVTTAAPTYTTGQMNALSLTTSGFLRVDGSGVTQPVSGTVAATQSGTWTVQPGNTANTTPWLTTINQGGNSATVTASNALKVDGSAVTQPISGTVTANIGTTNGLALDTSVNGILVSQGSTTSGEKGPLIQGAVTTAAPSYTTAQTSPLSLTTAGALRIDGSAVTQPVSGTVTANAGTGNFTVVQATAANLKAQTASESTTATSTGSVASLIGGAVTTASPTYTTGQMDPLSLTTAGALRVDGSGVTQPISGTVTANAGTGTFTVAGTVTSNQGTSPWVTNITQFGGNNVVTGTGASGTGIPRVTVSNDSNILATQSGTWTVAQGAPNSLANKWPVQITDGTNTMPTGDTVGRAIFQKITDGTDTAAVTAASTAPAATDQALVVALSPNTNLFAFGGDQRLRVGQETLLFFDNVDGTTIDTNKWTQSQSGMTQTQTGGNLTLNAGSSLTSGNYSILSSNKQMIILDEFPLYVQFRARLIQQTNAVIEIGFGNAATTATPTDGVFFRIDATGNLKGVINFNGTETTTATLTTLTASTFYNFEVTIYEDHAAFEVQSSDGVTNVDVDLAIPLANGSPVSVGHLPVYARVYNSATTSAAAQIVIASVNVQQMDLNMNKPWAEQVAGAGRAASIDPSTLAQSANYTNNTVPSVATLSNTAAGYTNLGGLFRFNAPAGAETDYALFAYQVPTGFQLYIWSVTIAAFITGAQSSTNPTLLQWAIATNSSAVSLATGAPNPPVFLPIGMQQAPKTASIGDTFAPGTISFIPKTPIVINSGKFFHIVLRVPIGNATASQVIRGSVTVEGYFE